MWQIWLIITIILLIASFRHPSSRIICLFITSTLTLALSFFLANFLLDIIIFFLITAFIQLLLQKHLLRLQNSPNLLMANTNDLINQTGIVIKPIGNHPFDTGLVHINHEIWIASSCCPISKGTTVQVINIQGLRISVIPLSHMPH